MQNAFLFEGNYLLENGIEKRTTKITSTEKGVRVAKNDALGKGLKPSAEHPRKLGTSEIYEW